MDKKEIKKRKKRRNKLIKSLVLAVAFVVAIGATFGVTMAYFGGKSSEVTKTMTLKTGLYLKAGFTDGSVTSTAYVVPSQVLDIPCQVSVKSADAKGSKVNTGDSASDALIRAKVVFNAGTTGATMDSGGHAYFPVTIGGSTVGNFVKATGEDYYYLMVGETITTDALMYVVKSSEAEQTLTYTLNVKVPNNLTNEHGGDSISLTLHYEVIQADFFKTTSTPVAKTVANAKEIFETVKDTDASYTTSATS